MKKLIVVIGMLSFAIVGCDSIVGSTDKEEQSYKKYGDPTMEMPAPEKPDTSPTYHE